jgi:hypothetical protein
LIFLSTQLLELSIAYLPPPPHPPSGMEGAMEGQWSGNGGAMQGMEGMEAHYVPSLSARALSLSRPGCLSLSFLARPPAVSFFLTLIFSLSHTCPNSQSHTCLLPLTRRAAWRGQWRGNGGAMVGQCKEWKEWRRIAPPPSARALALSLSPQLSLSIVPSPPARRLFFFLFFFSLTHLLDLSITRPLLSLFAVSVCVCVWVWVCGCVGVGVWVCGGVCVCVLCVVDI